MFNRLSYRKAIHDIVSGLYGWRIWYLLGVTEIRKRYSRSHLGQFWLAITNAVSIAAIGFMWSFIFKIDIKEYLPFVAVGFIYWSLVAGSMNEGAEAFINSGKYMHQLTIAKSSYVYSVILKNLIILAHNLVVLIPVFIFFPNKLGWVSLLVLPGLLLTLWGGIATIFILAIVCLRYRDVRSLVANVLQVSFYLTPIIWKPNLVPGRVYEFMIYNPFAVFLALVRDPLLGSFPDHNYVLVALMINLVLSIVALVLFARYRARLAFWL